MDLKEMYREIVNEHNLHPTHKYDFENPTMFKRGVNPSCGDDLTINLKVEDGVIQDGSYVGNGCAISQASGDMMMDLIIGKTVDEAKHLADIFNRMIKGEVTDEELEELEDAQALIDISHMPARVKCALLSWRTLSEMLGE
ncbi:MAG: SUF system NifU family Fe-S cluster assembly protein [Lachnospiraceae bacterium]|nr:SUF system NifU family Fe-S cluster assembly protein [Lachnospiraceae bacterium]